MFEYHGWITVRETAVDDDDDLRLRHVVDELRLRVAQTARAGAVGRRSSGCRNARKSGDPKGAA
ncbi:Imm7 family immunity protein [Streptomyces sp. NPDC000656]|uniref:Imm7 family immunity protein n=1 Tax=Streptomyces sp. NPDC000656 TaxID=3364540 RepID=UPI00368CB995